MRVENHANSKLGWRYVCKNKSVHSNRVILNALGDTWFGGVRLDFKVVLGLIACFLRGKKITLQKNYIGAPISSIVPIFRIF